MIQQRSFELLLFDLDGVVTTEHIYWECARLTIWKLFQTQLQAVAPYRPAVHDVAAREDVIPEAVVYAIKNRAINSNWDLTFLVACSILCALPAKAGQGADTPDALLARLRHSRLVVDGWRAPVVALLEATADLSGVKLLKHAGQAAARHLGISEALLTPDGPFWQMLYVYFQGWYSGKLMGAWGAFPLPEQPVVPVREMHQVFAALQAAGYTLGIVTGRPLVEAVYALEKFDVLQYFVPRHMVTFDDVAAAQHMLGQSGLGKPHPFAVRKAICPDLASEALARENCRPELAALMIGDSTSDALAADRAGIPCLGVTSGVSGQAARTERQQALLNARCVAVLDDIRSLPEWLTQFSS